MYYYDDDAGDDMLVRYASTNTVYLIASVRLVAYLSSTEGCGHFSL